MIDHPSTTSFREGTTSGIRSCDAHDSPSDTSHGGVRQRVLLLGLDAADPGHLLIDGAPIAALTTRVPVSSESEARGRSTGSYPTVS